MRLKSALNALAVGCVMLLLVAIGASFTADQATAQSSANPAILAELQSLRSEVNALRPRQFYLTTTTHDGLSAPTACTAGYHMASLWEIFDPTHLRYDRTLGASGDDAGSGPPANDSGWIRTGANAQTAAGPGDANCNAYTSNSNGDAGTLVELTEEWDFTGSAISPWTGRELQCNATFPVWCVQD